MRREAAWAAVAEERVRLADDLAGVDDAVWSRPSRCGGWTVQEVLGHLVYLAEGTVWSVMVKGARLGVGPNRAADRAARQTAASATGPELLDRLRAAAGGRFVVPGLPATVALGEVLVHRADIAEAADLPRLAADERVRAVLEAERRLWFAFGVPRRARSLRFEPTDADWSVGPAGAPVVRGPAQTLLLAATGRRDLPDLTGPGATLLTR